MREGQLARPDVSSANTSYENDDSTGREVSNIIAEYINNCSCIHQLIRWCGFWRKQLDGINGACARMMCLRGLHRGHCLRAQLMLLERSVCGTYPSIEIFQVQYNSSAWRCYIHGASYIYTCVIRIETVTCNMSSMSMFQLICS